MAPPPLPRPPTDHDRHYTVALAVFAGLLVLGAVSLTSFINRPDMDPQGRWAMSLARNIELCVLLAAVVVLVVRVKYVEARKWVTLVFNLLMLLYFPLGTALAIYGLLKADKTQPAITPKLPS